MLSIESFIEQTNRATTVDELFEHYKKAMMSLGFDQIIFSLMTNHASIERPAGHGIIANYSESWMKYYQEKKYEDFDPVRRHMFAAPGLKDGIGIPLYGPRGALAGVGAASSAGGVELDDKMLLSKSYLLSQQFYAVFLALEAQRLKNRSQEPINLTDREQEVLKWCARGKSKPEIAEILGISENTVHTYVRDSLAKLEANNVTLGVLRALQMGLIQI